MGTFKAKGNEVKKAVQWALQYGYRLIGVCVCVSLSLVPSFRVFWVLLLSVDSHFCFRQFLRTIMCRLKTQNGGVLGIRAPTARQEPSVGPKFPEQPRSRSLPGDIKNQ